MASNDYDPIPTGKDKRDPGNEGEGGQKRERGGEERCQTLRSPVLGERSKRRLKREAIGNPRVPQSVRGAEEWAYPASSD